MPIDLKDFAIGKRKKELTWQGHTFFVEYKLGFRTVGSTDVYRKAIEEKGANAAFLDRFCEYVINWDVTDGDKGVIPRTPQGLSGVLWSFLNYIWSQIDKDSTLGEPTSDD